ncbi:ABC transporter substrate-binding protein [Agarivorans sp. TSD2052]|uniref:substrate-binding periplasmic protein n=1 Tax=Agarivorans sp. TSD2052 TaxID=2937286 RepID=UPI00200FBBE7|nr:ABC transporter substrate-binding protein [Agarivorans sp. TSD2052]UPW18527.1 ABC transporter substrate-binding protein [Agarivorans sp. TSD2052]
MKIIVIVYLLIHSFTSVASNISVATDFWEDYSNKDGTGYYFALLKRVFPEHQYAFHFMPYPRSIAMLEKQQVDLVFGASEDEFDNANCSSYIVEADVTDMLVSEAFYDSYMSLDDLVGKRVVSHLGYDWADSLPEGTKYSEYSDLTQMIKLLKKGRVDAILDYRADIEALLALAPELDGGIAIIDSVLSYGSTFCFAATDKGAELLSQFEQVMPLLIESDELHQIMIDQVDSDVDYPY